MQNDLIKDRLQEFEERLTDKPIRLDPEHMIMMINWSNMTKRALE